MNFVSNIVVAFFVLMLVGTKSNAESYDGQYFSGRGDSDFLRLLEISYSLFQPNPERQDIGMLYSPVWNGFVEGPTWGAWWIQNSYGTTIGALPFLQEPHLTFLQNAQDLWFTQMGDGKRKGFKDWIAPDGQLCDAASPGWIVYKQGDGRTDFHDWGVEFTAAGVVMQAELLLISRDRAAIDKYLPLLERCAALLESRRDPANNLFLAGAAGNLLAPSYAGFKKPDGTYGMAYLAGLSVTYIAALDRLIELEKLANRLEIAERYRGQRESARAGLSALTQPEGYLMKSLDPDGTRHGVYGAPKHGYFEAVCNHDAIALRVVDDAQSRRIYDFMAGIPGLRPHGLIITNYPSLDDMYEKPEGLWGFGTWVNGGHWTTCEARMMMAYYRVGAFDDARRSIGKIVEFSRQWRMDNPLVEFGRAVYQPALPINCTYDAWGAPAGFLRGLFEYVYGADSLTLYPHVPPGIDELNQKIPVRFGDKLIYIATRGSGPVSDVRINGVSVQGFDEKSVRLAFDSLQQIAFVGMGLGGAAAPAEKWPVDAFELPVMDDAFWNLEPFTAHLSDNQLPLRIGADSSGGSFFRGGMRRVRIYDRALTADEVTALAANPAKAEPLKGLILDFDLASPNAGRVEEKIKGLSASYVGELHSNPDGACLEFEAKGFAQAPYDPLLPSDSAFTIDAWLRPGENAETGGRIVDHVTVGTDDGFLLDLFPRNIPRLITPFGNVSASAPLPPGEWAHLAATADPKGELRLYVNGRQVASIAAKQKPSTWLEPAGALHAALAKKGQSNTYAARHAELIIRYVAAIHERMKLRSDGKLPPLASPASEAAADKAYIDTVTRLFSRLPSLDQGSR